MSTSTIDFTADQDDISAIREELEEERGQEPSEDSRTYEAEFLGESYKQNQHIYKGATPLIEAVWNGMIIRDQSEDDLVGRVDMDIENFQDHIENLHEQVYDAMTDPDSVAPVVEVNGYAEGETPAEAAGNLEDEGLSVEVYIDGDQVAEYDAEDGRLTSTLTDSQSNFYQNLDGNNPASA